MASAVSHRIDSESLPPRSGASSSVADLPNEILLAIFYAGRNIRRRRDRLPHAVILSHVCRSWRTLALGTPGLWTWIDLANCGNNDMYGVFLERSRPRLLHMTLFVASQWARSRGPHHEAGMIGMESMRTIPDLMDVVEREIVRITSLHITANDIPVTLAFVLPRLRHLRAPNLRYFGTSRDDIPRFGSKAGPDNLLQGGAPLLTHARISSLVLGVPPLTNLSSLIIHRPQDSDQRAIRYAEFRQLLLAPSRLESLVLEGRIVEREGLETLNPVSLPHLISLHIELENEDEGSGHAFMLYLLQTPAIQSLTLVNAMATSTINSFLTFCDAHEFTPYPHLRRLSLNGGGSIGSLITKVARALPTISELRCIIWNTSDVLLRLIQSPRCGRCKGFHVVAGDSHEDLVARVRASGEVPYWPNLRSFTFQYAGDSALYDFLVARELIGCPINELRTGQFAGRMTPEWEKWLHEHSIKVISVDVELEEREVTEPYRHEDFELDDIPIYARQI